MRKFMKTFITVAVVSSLLVTPVFAAPGVDDLKQKKASTESEVNNLQEELKQVMVKMQDLEQRMTDKGIAIKTANVELEDAQEKEIKQYEDMKLRIKYMYEDGDTSFLENLISSKSITEMLNKAEYVSAIHSQDRKMLQDYVETKQDIETMKTNLEKEMTNLKKMNVEYDTEQDNLTATIESKRGEMADFDAQLQAAAAKAAEEAAKAQEAARQQAVVSNGGQGSSNGWNPSNTIPTPPPSIGGGGSGDSSVASIIVSAAYSQLGVPYVWGGNEPGVALDCSGLTKYCHAVAGITIARVDTGQLAGGRRVSNPLPGDIAWTPGHVAIYIGGGQMIEAQQEGVPICISPVRASVYVRYW
ncbi:MAG: NlpC/P60 family protein [Lachnospiraceae bacterium]